MTNTSRRLYACLSVVGIALLLGGCGGNAPYSPIIADASSDLVLTLENPTVTVEQGASAVFKMNLRAVGSFSAPATVVVHTLPLQWSLTPGNVVTPTTSGTPLSLTVPTGGVAVGDYEFTVSATGGGLTRAVALTLRVTGVSIGIAPESRTLLPGGTAEYTVTVTPLNGHTLSASLEISGLPSNVESSFNPDTVTFSGSSPRTSQLVLSLPDDGGSHPVNRGSAGQTFTVTARSGAGSVYATAVVIIDDRGGIDAIIR
ncbi:MAG: hypothetical protein GX446_16455 [Chthonomonadales bacterium]|nr:hypothetical protein [Chthonomonadales bacterium]